MSVFSSVRGNRVGRSVFNLSHVKRFTCDMGELIPALFLECVPGDTFKIGADVVTRFQPLVAPILDSVDMTVHYFFVPTRLLMDNEKDWETFLTGGKDGTDESVSLPLFQFRYYDGTTVLPVAPFSNDSAADKYSLWDYFGLPLPIEGSGKNVADIRDANHVLGFPQRAYNLVFNEFYLDENLGTKVSLENSTLLYRSWKKDYFTSSLPWQQRGVSPALPISGVVPVDISSLVLGNPSVGISQNQSFGSLLLGRQDPSMGTIHDFDLLVNRSIDPSNSLSSANVDEISSSVVSHNGTVNLQNASTFDVAVLREAFQIQRWLELNARGGVRYTEFLNSHFGIAPRDEVLQRPQYIGGTKSSIVVSEVLQTSSSNDTSPQGHLAGHGLGAMSDFICTYTAKEFGYIIGIASWMPKPSYQQGVNRIFSRQTKFDFYFPEFAHLSEQAVNKGEIYATGVEDHDNSIFGYQSCYSEMRYMPSFNCGDMRDTFKYWHLGRIFTSDPSLNAGFLTTNPKYSGGIRKDIFADHNSKGLLVQFGNVVKAIRPLPVYGTPGFIDHVGRM